MSDQTKPKLLDTPCLEVFKDKPLLKRLVRAVALDKSLFAPDGAPDFPSALGVLHQGVEDAGGAKATLDAALKAAFVDPENVAQTVDVSRRRDAALRAVYERAISPRLLEQRVNRDGLVMLDQADGAPGSDGAGLDIGRAIADPVERENRLARMRRIDPNRWGVEDGRKRFLQEDKMHLESGLDMVASAERNLEIAAARGQAAQVAHQLDAAIAEAGYERQRIKKLEAQIATLEGPELATAQETARESLRSRRAAATQPVLRLLDQLEAGEADGSVRVLDQEQSLRPIGEAVARENALEALARENGLGAKARELDEEVKRRLKGLDRPQSDYVVVLEQVVAGVPAPIEPDEPEIPPGIHSGSHLLHQRVVERMKQLELPDSEYDNALQAILREG